MSFRATDFHASYSVAKPFTLPHHTRSMLRGVLGRALRQTGCAVVVTACVGACARPEACTYARLFDPLMPSPAPHRFLQGGTRAPPRLIPLLPAMGKAHLPPDDTSAPRHEDHPAQVFLAKNDRMTFGVRVLGELDDATDKCLMSALEGMETFPLGAEKGQVKLESTTRHRTRTWPDGAEGAPTAGSRVRVTFTTPAWIEHDGRLVKDLTFSRLFRAISRRVTTVGALYGELGADQPDQEETFVRLDALAGEVKTVETRLVRLQWVRHSEESGARHPMHGFTGYAVFEGEVGELWPSLNMAEVAHVGKSTSFGLGRVRVDVEGG